jgi:hypothetical protein
MDFGEGENRGATVSTMGGELEGSSGYSSGLERVSEPSILLDHRILTVHIAQRELLDPTKGTESSNIATVANITHLAEDVKAHLYEAPCLIIHYGATSPDFLSFVALMRKIATKDVPIVCCGQGISGKDVITNVEIAKYMMKGVSVAYNVLGMPELEALARQLDLCVKQAVEEKKALSAVRLLIVIDLTACYLLGKAIRDEADDRLFLVDRDPKDKNGTRRCELITKYLPQVESSKEVTPTLICKDWEAAMSTHSFRNAHYPPEAIDRPKIPLDALGFITAFHPFGPSFIIASALLPNKGPFVKKLLESWVSTILGHPARFIRAE